jgi:hypothetical protein
VVALRDALARALDPRPQMWRRSIYGTVSSSRSCR